MPIMEIKILPLGTKTPSVSDYIAQAVKVLKKSKLKHQLTPMGTIVEGKTIKQLLNLAENMHRAVLRSGVARVVTFIELDDRNDKCLTMEGKVSSLRKKIRRPATKF
jgi:uncharacterized protein (TIGR00106 family)